MLMIKNSKLHSNTLEILRENEQLPTEILVIHQHVHHSVLCNMVQKNTFQAD